MKPLARYSSNESTGMCTDLHACNYELQAWIVQGHDVDQRRRIPSVLRRLERGAEHIGTGGSAESLLDGQESVRRCCGPV